MWRRRKEVEKLTALENYIKNNIDGVIVYRYRDSMSRRKLRRSRVQELRNHGKKYKHICKAYEGAKAGVKKEQITYLKS